MKNFNAFDLVAILLLVVGGINWGMIAAFDFNLVSYLFGDMTLITRSVYALVGLSAVYVAFLSLYESNTTTVNRVVLQPR